ncbi:cysteine hydrolase [Methylobrevis sp. L22]|uniref:Cysteine hydrolase n=1 Tax=Methylobrevis albus TaxID=2793297 RepID=A0A931MYH7_9HYPH|nr:cysteine hydrolase [Methylobrevis albus]
MPPVDAAPYAFPFDGRWSAADTALLLLGFQAGAVQALNAGDAVTVATDLLAAARRAGIAVIHVRRGAAEGAARGVAGVAPDAPVTGSPAWALVPALAAREGDLVLDVPGDQAFRAPALEGVLTTSGIRNLIVAGLPTDGLVHASMRAANDRGLECLVVADASAGTTPARHAAQLRITTFGNGLFGTVAPAAAVIAALSRTTP